MSTAGFRYSWRKMEDAAQDRAGWRRVVCGLYTTGSNKAWVVSKLHERCDHITPILQQLHWLPVQQRVLPVFSRPSTVVLVGRLSACLWFPTAPSPVIWFTNVCRSTCTQHVRWPVLCYCGLQVWNFLPAELKNCDFLRQFKRCLKTFLFGLWDYGALWRSVK